MFQELDINGEKYKNVDSDDAQIVFESGYTVYLANDDTTVLESFYKDNDNYNFEALAVGFESAYDCEPEYYVPVIDYAQVKHEFLMDYKSDRWGNSMGAHFAVAGEMYTRGLSIPNEWKYRPGMSPRTSDDSFSGVCVCMSDDDLIRFGNVLHRLENILEAQGHSY